MEWGEIERVMVIVAHPDDTEYGCAGTTARLTSEGKEVVYTIVTDGSKGSSDPEMTSEKMTSIREREQREAARIAGVTEVNFLGFPDGILEPSIDLRRAIAGCIRKYRPDVVISQSPSRNLSGSVFAQHPDHLAVGQATLAAIYPAARDRMTFPELLAQGLEPHAVKEVWISASEPDFFVDITKTLETKLDALKAHQSQVNPETIAEWIPQRARQQGEQAGYEYAEGFKRLTI